MKAQDTAELFFDDVRVPAANLVGKEGGGFVHLMEKLPQERLSIAVTARRARPARVFDLTLEYCKSRTAFGKPIGSFQHNRFVLAEMATELEMAETYVEKAVREHNAGRYDVQDAAMAKWWCTEMQKNVVDRCVQLHGGYGYMLEYPVAKAFIDSRVQTIYGGHDRGHEGDHRPVARCLRTRSGSTCARSCDRIDEDAPAAALPDLPRLRAGRRARLPPAGAARRRRGRDARTCSRTGQSGAPGIAHGGAVATVVDDLLGYLLYVVRKPGVTRTLEVEYLKPVMVGQEYAVRGRVDSVDGRKVWVSCDGHRPGRGAGLPRQRAVPRGRRCRTSRTRRPARAEARSRCRPSRSAAERGQRRPAQQRLEPRRRPRRRRRRRSRSAARAPRRRRPRPPRPSAPRAGPRPGRATPARTRAGGGAASGGRRRTAPAARAPTRRAAPARRRRRRRAGRRAPRGRRPGRRARALVRRAPSSMRLIARSQSASSSACLPAKCR